jgi:DNA-binding MarR family transcriptional regulator
MASTDVATQHGIPRTLEHDLGWVLGRVVNGYAATAARAISDVPGGLRGYQVLTAVADGCPGTQLELGRQLGIDRSVMTNVLDTIEAAKLIERRPDPADRRARLITITAAGRRVQHAAAENLAKVEHEVFGRLPAADRKQVRDALRELASSFYRGNPELAEKNVCTEVPSLESAAKVWSV